MQNSTTDCETRKSLNVVLTLGSSARRYLASQMNADQDCLALAWVESGWIVGILPEELPGDNNARRAHLGKYKVIIYQPDHMSELDGRKLECVDGVLSVV